MSTWTRIEKSRARFVSRPRYLRRLRPPLPPLPRERGFFRDERSGCRQGRNLCYGRTCRAHARSGPRDIRGAAAQTLLMDARRRRSERCESDGGRGREKRGLLTVCRLNVLGPLLNQLTYCLCGRQPLPCLHGTFLLSFPPVSPPPDVGGVPSVRPFSSSSSFFHSS